MIGLFSTMGRVIVILSTIFLIPVLVSAAVPEPISLRVGLHLTFARLVIDLPYPIQYSTKREGRKIYISMDPHIHPSLKSPLPGLQQYIERAWVNEKGNQFLLQLWHDWPVQIFSLPGRIVVDIYHTSRSKRRHSNLDQSKNTNHTTPFSSVPSEKTKPSMLKLRTEEHKDFSRLIFDWLQPVRYNLQPVPTAVAVHFNQKAKLDLAVLAYNPLRHLVDLDYRIGDNGTVILLIMPPGGGVHHFLKGPSIIFDIYSKIANSPKKDLVRPVYKNKSISPEKLNTDLVWQAVFSSNPSPYGNPIQNPDKPKNKLDQLAYELRKNPPSALLSRSAINRNIVSNWEEDQNGTIKQKRHQKSSMEQKQHYGFTSIPSRRMPLDSDAAERLHKIQIQLSTPSITETAPPQDTFKPLHE